MERDARYILIGLLLVVSIALSVVFVIWSANSQDEETAAHYRVFFSDSISGLGKGSSVRYLGVPVGSVTGLSIGRLSESDETGVIVEIAVQNSVDVDSATLAKLQTNGLTGRATIELQRTPGVGGVQSAESPTAFEGVIPGKASSIGKLTEDLPEIADQMGDTLERIQRLLSDGAIADTHATISQLRDTTARFAGAAGSLDALIQAIRTTNSQVQTMIPRYIAVADDMTQTTLPAINESAARMRTTATLISTQMSDNSAAFKSFIGDSRRTVEIFRDQMVQTSENLRKFTNELRENPSRLVYKQKEYGVRFEEDE